MPLNQPGIISQARMTSTRLPGKVLKKIGGKTLLEYHLERLSWSGLPVIVATTVNKTDDPIAQLCEKLGISVFRGDEQDVLSRYSGAADMFHLDPIVRVTSDCPLIDGHLIKQSVQAYIARSNPWLYASNCLERTYPRGFDFEIFSKHMLQEASEKALSPGEREHVTPYFYQNKHGKTVDWSIARPVNMSQYRLTVDQPEDFQLIEKLILEFNCAEKNESEICQILEKHPELAQINSHIEQKKL